MGEWSDYFEDFPEENPANWVGGRFDPAAAARQCEIESANRRVAKDSAALQKEMFKMAEDAKKKAKERQASNGTETTKDSGL